MFYSTLIRCLSSLIQHRCVFCYCWGETNLSLFFQLYSSSGYNSIKKCNQVHRTNEFPPEFNRWIANLSIICVVIVLSIYPVRYICQSIHILGVYTVQLSNWYSFKFFMAINHFAIGGICNFAEKFPIFAPSTKSNANVFSAFIKFR